MSDDLAKSIRNAASLISRIPGTDDFANGLRGLADDADKMTARIRELEAEREWRPIETSPKDGTEVLVYATSPAGDLPPFIGRAAYHPDAGWCVCTVREVTHWMPLPTPPKEGE